MVAVADVLMLPLRLVGHALYASIEPVLDRGLALGDLLVVVLAQLLTPFLMTPYILGRSPSAQREAVQRIQRPFLELAFLTAQVALPMGRHGYSSTSTLDTTLPSREAGRAIPVRIVTPKKMAQSDVLVLFMHGGGLYLGSGVGEALLYRFFAARLNATVVSVDYRMVPEHRFPAAIDDCEDAARALLAKPEYANHRLVLLGMSAGGYLSIQTALVLAHAGIRVTAHGAIAPMVGPFAAFESIASNDWLSLFPSRSIQWSWSHFLRDLPPHMWDWRVSALLASNERLGTTSPGCVAYHTFDTLRDEGAAYAERLAAVGRLHAARELPYPHGSGIAMGRVLEAMAEMLESRLAKQPPTMPPLAEESRGESEG